MNIDKARSKMILAKTYQSLKGTIDQDVISEAGIPSYLEGTSLSRWFAWKKVEEVADLCGGPAKNILDFGCGSGILFSSFLNYDNLFAADVDLRIARKTAQIAGIDSIQFIQPDELEKIADNSLDLIIAANVLEHVPSLIDCVNLFSRKLNDRGMLIVSGPTENTLYKLGRKVLRLLGHKQFTGEYHHTNIMTIYSVIASNGFALNKKKMVPFGGVFTLYWIGRFVKEPNRR